MLVRPRMVPRMLGVDSASAARTGWVVQMLGARELALGLGTLAALRASDSRASRLWVAGGALCDTVDALALSGALLRGRLSRISGGAAVGVSLCAAALGWRALEPDVPQD
jgi:hypothetical protein